MTTSAPSISLTQGPRVFASHLTTRQSASTRWRDKITTSWPSVLKARASTVPTCPEPPGIMIFMSVNHASANRAFYAFQYIESLLRDPGVYVENDVADLFICLQILRADVDLSLREPRVDLTQNTRDVAVNMQDA